MAKRKTLAERIRRLRFDEGYNQAQLGERIGVTASTICRYENGLQPSVGAGYVFMDKWPGLFGQRDFWPRRRKTGAGK